MSKSEKLIKYQKLQKKYKQILSVMKEDLGKVKKNVDKRTNSKLPISVLKDNLAKIKQMKSSISKINDMLKKMGEITSSLNKDEKKEFKKLGI
jgi:hypothetical protein